LSFEASHVAKVEDARDLWIVGAPTITAIDAEKTSEYDERAHWNYVFFSDPFYYSIKIV
jgi:hypothetical protein